MYLMLIFTLVVAFSEAKKQYPAIPLPPKLISLILEKSPACIKETGAKADVMQQFFTMPLDTNETSKKYNFCLFTSIGICDEDGYFDVHKVLAFYKYSSQKNILRVEKTTTECNKVVAENPIETMYQALQCFYVKAPAWIPPKSE